MATIITKAAETYNYYIWEKSHPKAAEYFLLGSPFPMVFLLILYLVIGFKGHKFMEHRKPYNLKYIMICYNILQAYINITFFYHVFMVLRKNQKQISVLHLYHHFNMALSCWLVTKYIPGGDPGFLGALNCFVHTIMYSYYLVTALFPQYKGNIWWKRHITELQICQFGIIMLQMTVGLLTPGCQYPRMIHIYILTQTSIVFVLFLNFYIKSYLLKKKTS